MSEFTYDWYSAFLSHCRLNGNMTLLRDVETGSFPQIVLRHDVDFDLAAAQELSLLEERAGVRSTYLVLVSTHYYNPASLRSREILRSLVQRGFEVGLHFDPTVYIDDSLGGLAAGFEAERAFLESLLGSAVSSVSLHIPTSYGRYPVFQGVVNAYDERWFGPERYVSDSLRRWKHDPFALVSKVKDLGRVQVLCHPIHFGREERTYKKALDCLAEAWRSEAHSYIYEKNQTYRDECSGKREGEEVCRP